MLRRDRLIRMQIHELMDACLFAVAFWLAYVLRANPDVIDMLGLPAIDPADRYEYVWLYLLLIPAAPMILEAQGFYNRPVLCSRSTTAWLLFKSCVAATLGLVLMFFLFRIEIARWIIIWFGCISFGLVFLKEELLLMGVRSKLGQAQNRRRFILVGTSEETMRLRREMKVLGQTGIDVVAELNLSTTPVERLVEMLHDYSVNGVILSGNRAYFDQVDAAIRTCELEGVEVWLVADFFKTQICRTSLDDFLGKPVLVFRSTPEASWQSVTKQLIDFFGALALLSVTIPVFLVIA